MVRGASLCSPTSPAVLAAATTHRALELRQAGEVAAAAFRRVGAAGQRESPRMRSPTPKPLPKKTPSWKGVVVSGSHSFRDRFALLMVAIALLSVHAVVTRALSGRAVKSRPRSVARELDSARGELVFLYECRRPLVWLAAAAAHPRALELRHGHLLPTFAYRRTGAAGQRECHESLRIISKALPAIAPRSARGRWSSFDEVFR